MHRKQQTECGGACRDLPRSPGHLDPNRRAIEIRCEEHQEREEKKNYDGKATKEEPHAEIRAPEIPETDKEADRCDRPENDCDEPRDAETGGAHPLPSDYCQSDQDNGNSERFYGHADNRG